MDRTATGLSILSSSCRVSVTSCRCWGCLLCFLPVCSCWVPSILGGDDKGHGRREGPTREDEVSRDK